MFSLECPAGFMVGRGSAVGRGLAPWWGKIGAVGEILGQELRLEVEKMNIDSSAQSWTSPCGEMFLFCKRIRWKFIGFWSNYIYVRVSAPDQFLSRIKVDKSCS